MISAPTDTRRRASLSPAWAALAPLTIVLALFFVVPIGGMVVTSLLVTGSSPGTSTFSADNFTALGSGSRSMALKNSLLLSFTAASVAAVFGGICAWAISTVKSKVVDSLTAVISSVLANDGGVPLAFSFIVAVGNTGYFTALITAVDSTFTLYSVKGLILMYQYFLIPTMILLTLPSFVALKQQWREANTSLGGSSWTFWRRVGLPVITPALLGAWLLMFGSAFGTHASAAVLIGTGAFPLIPLEIAGQLAGSAATGGEGVAMALGVTTGVIAVIVLIAFNALTKRSAKWLNS
ncbi:ABC transporter permease [Brevibacterium aurantiacum]|uniref:Putative spermidine/putrescine transport system permease protein n=1 Tax=Brevibacterium aurantiacum TaxID=273384 RepID=A0A2H1IF16_BREAU|nr:spermidine/putrescine ABC transporter permease [Brevibacterium aurantiacum]MDN5594632.1 spermidine/putrescine ABC transporter permease [Brevibacterium sp.]AZL04846.1 spermidine/putrescine ABC transporter permease [Brevibacterium aurantiacum]AZL12044.1 spermidine/putrescine ABC transporter permease [Brevibacterium aurantiacum]AZT92414.1 spermidine/putrescine ABC transporter permease [Brevibacterium aurantiacum]MDN5607325.1 spermidine/putrescine ABC transporter permease [Brevibacterium sp.]